MGLAPTSPLATIRACVAHLRALLSGETVTADELFVLDRIALTHPCVGPVPPIRRGVSGPRMLDLAGQIADGIVLSVMSSVEYVTWARDHVVEGAERAHRDPDSIDTVVYAFCSVDQEDASAARHAVRHRLAFYLAGRPDSAITRGAGIADQVVELARGGPEAVEARMPAEWTDRLTVAATPKECAAQIIRLRQAGATAVQPFPAQSMTSKR